jgi:hypothetical protein
MRRRLKGKHGPGALTREALAVVAIRARPHVGDFRKLPMAEQTQARHKIRNYLFKQCALLKKGGIINLKNGCELQYETEAEFLQSQTHVRKQLLLDLALSDNDPAEIIGAVASRWCEETGNEPKPNGRPPMITEGMNDTPLRSHQLVLTWHGDFGARNVCTASMSTMTLNELEQIVKQAPSVKNAWEVIRICVHSLRDRFKLAGVAFALEICPNEWTEKNKMKLHVHAWLLQAFGQQKLTMADLRIPGGKCPFISLYGHEMRKGLAVYAGCFYYICEKHGQLFSYSSKQPHVDFAVKPDWVHRLFGCHKMTYDFAQFHLMRHVTNCRAHVQDLKTAASYFEEQCELEERRLLLAKIRGQSKPYRVLEEVHAWAKQYDRDNIVDRYKFLVLEGPSDIGKTRFVQGNLVEKPEFALILDCSDAVVLALKGNFKRSLHKLVMFDEAHAEMIIRVKKLFQASINPSSYGSSPTNNFITTVWLHGIKLVVGSNVWSEELSALPKADRLWIQKNSIHINTDVPLYIE